MEVIGLIMFAPLLYSMPYAIVWGTPVEATVSKKQFTAVTLPIVPPPL